MRGWIRFVLACGLFGVAERLHGAETVSTYLKKSPDWFASKEGRQVVGHVLSWQSDAGSWPKNQSTVTEPYRGDRGGLKGTFDNGATLGELRLLARAVTAGSQPDARKAFERGLDHVLDAQYASGGWPQFAPPGNGYHRHITFNDGVMVNLLNFLRELGADPVYAWVDTGRRHRAASAFDKGVEAVLQCQITHRGAKTVWCAQHDERTFEPRPARTYEKASFSGGESAGILLFLMSIESPSTGVVDAVRAGAEWFRAQALSGIRVVKAEGDTRVVRDPSAPLIWARFYDLEEVRPLFCGRDGIPRSRLSEIELERRNGYAWYGTWGQAVLDRYPAWARRYGVVNEEGLK